MSKQRKNGGGKARDWLGGFTMSNIFTYIESFASSIVVLFIGIAWLDLEVK